MCVYIYIYIDGNSSHCKERADWRAALASMRLGGARTAEELADLMKIAACDAVPPLMVTFPLVFFWIIYG